MPDSGVNAAPAGPFFGPNDYILTVGDGDFAFSLQLARMVGGATLMASTLDSQEFTLRTFPQSLARLVGLDQCGAIVTYNFDATARKADWDVQFDRIIFNFPESTLGSDDLTEAVPDNQYLLAAFLYEAARLLLPHGQIFVTIKRGFPFDLWDLPSQAELCPYLEAAGIVPLPHDQYPHYEPRYTGLNEAFPLDGAELHIFQLRPEYSALALNNNLRSEPHRPPSPHAFLRRPLGPSAPTATSLDAGVPMSASPLATSPYPTRAQLPGADLKPFAFSHVHDRQGIVYYLGLKAGHFVTWRNPVAAGLVSVRASSIKRGSRLGVEVGDHTFTHQVFFTDNVPGSFVIIDFGDHLISPTCYVMSHRSGVADFFVRKWLFQGSVDGVAWRTIRVHDNDGAINVRAWSAAWEVDSRGEFFHQFRIVLAPGGNSRGTHALVVSCFEVYGVLHEA